MEKLKTETKNKAEENFKKLSQLFPNAVTETIDENGKVVKAIDKDVLMQEISCKVIDGKEERYQFTWPDKRKSILLSNLPINKTLRPIQEDSLNFYNTQNLYIEGDNLEVLKLLQETYLNSIKMIYIDPPYNTGNDLIYKDDFTESIEDYLKHDSQVDEEGNRLVSSKESDGRFHTNWLNMMYPRLRVARDLLSEDGVIFISIDDHEVENLKKICHEVFGNNNFVAVINWKGRGGRQDSKYYASVHEYILVYAKNIQHFQAGEEIKSGDVYPKYDIKKDRFYKTQLLRKWGSNSRREDRPNLFYPILAPDGSEVYPMLPDTIINGIKQVNYGRWRHAPETMEKNIKDGKVEFLKKDDGNWVAYEKIFAPLPGEEKTKKYITWIEESNDGAAAIKELFSKSVFDYPKPPKLIKQFLKMANVGEKDIVLDFFSGSATTAQAVMEMNAEDGGSRRFIMIQIPELCNQKSEAYKEGYRTICEVGKERIKRAAEKIKKENPQASNSLDLGYRVLKCDTSNFKDVLFDPANLDRSLFDTAEENIKEDRTAEDLLIQSMIYLGIYLSSKIERLMIRDKEVFNVADGFLLACFDKDVDEETIIEIAKFNPYYFVMRDSSLANDSVATNFDQIFEVFSPSTIRKVL